jgi:hypothetical protein
MEEYQMRSTDRIKLIDSVLECASELKYELKRVPVHKGAVWDLLSTIDSDVYKLKNACREELNINLWIIRKGEDPREVAPEVADRIADYPDNNKCLFCGDGHERGAVIAFCKPADGNISVAGICLVCASFGRHKLTELTHREIWNSPQELAFSKVDDERLARHRAAKLGWHLRRSRQRRGSDNAGEFILVDKHGTVLLGAGYTATAIEILAFIARRSVKQAKTEKS